MSPEVTAALLGLIGIIVGAIPTYIFMRQKNKAEIEKLNAETDKIKAEAEKIRSEFHSDRVFTLPQLDEQLWLDTVIKYLGACQSASVYLRYFRDPDYGDDERLSGIRDKIRKIMILFSRLLLDHKERFILIGFSKRAWMDNPKHWLVQQMLQTRPDISEAEARAVVDSHIVVIHDEPVANSSTIYLLDNRYLFYNRVSGEIGNERKTYHAEDLSNSILPALLKRGLCDFLGGTTPESSEYDKKIIDH
jgi:hypothetical protein